MRERNGQREGGGREKRGIKREDKEALHVH